MKNQKEIIIQKSLVEDEKKLCNQKEEEEEEETQIVNETVSLQRAKLNKMANIMKNHHLSGYTKSNALAIKRYNKGIYK